MEKRIREMVKEFEMNWKEARIVAGKNYMFDDPAFLEKVKQSLFASLVSVRKATLEEVLEIVNGDSAIDGQYLEPCQTRKHERSRITERIDELLTNK